MLNVLFEFNVERKAIKIFAVTTAVLLLGVSSVAAHAGEARVEVRGGVAFASAFGFSTSEGVVGVAGGYDFDISDAAFIGAEGSADKVLDGSSVFWGVGARVGGKLGDKTRLYANGGLGFGGGDTSPYAGAGVQQKLGGNFYGKIEYRRYFDTIDVNTAAVGFGLAF